MIGPCPYICNNKSELGYCLTTVCINPTYYLKDIPIMNTFYYNSNSPCQNYLNNPNNGGSGICHCVLGNSTIY